MSKPLKIIGVVAGVVAVAAAIGSGIGVVLGGTMVLAGVGSAASIAAVAASIAAAATLGSQVLAKPPPARGSITQTRVEVNPPNFYPMGVGLLGGTVRYRRSYGATLDDVPNPYRYIETTFGTAGPIKSISPRYDFEPIDSWYDGFLFTDTQLGATPEAAPLSPQWAGAPGRDSTSKYSGHPAIGWSFLFDKKGERFARGIGQLQAYGEWTSVYDPRQDDTQPGGSGPCRLGDESTYVWDGLPGDLIPAFENPALQAGTYAYGRYANNKLIIGLGLPETGIDWLNIGAWANLCSANEWTIFGRVTEPGDKWVNLREIALAGGGEPIPGAQLSFKYHTPVLPLDTITQDDLTEDNQSVMAMQPFRDRINTVIAQYTSPTNNYELVDSEPIVNTTFLAEDGEPRRDTWPFNLVKKADQAAQLAAYRMFDTRELNPITLVCKPRLRKYRPGECLTLDIPDIGLDTDAIILKRKIDPVSMKVMLTLIGETPEKHAYCLGQTMTPPPTPSLGQTSRERDELAAAALRPAGIGTIKLSGSYTVGLAGNVTQTHDGTGTGTVTITIPTHTREYADGTEATITGGTVQVAETSTFLLCYDDPTFSDGEIGVDITVVVIEPSVGGDVAADAYFSAVNPSRHFLLSINTVDEAGTGGTTGGSSPPGGGGWIDDGDGPGTEIP